MEPEKFNDLVNTMKVMKSADSNFSIDRFVNFADLTQEQKAQIERDFKQKKKMWVENAFYYGYFENDYF